VFIKYKENIIKHFRIYTSDLNYVIRSSIIIFDKLKKDNTINLHFRSIRNTLPDREPKSRPRNKIPGSEEQKIIPKPPR
jgi:hypothetical protein